MADGSRQAVLDGYYQGRQEERNPLALRKKSNDRTDTAVLVAEFDPETEILKPVSLLINCQSPKHPIDT